jgi:hypothetical protein
MPDRPIGRASSEKSEAEKLLKRVRAIANSDKKLQAGFDARERKRKELENLPLEVIRRARELSMKNKFRRRIVKATPKNFDTDIVELECGHTTSIFFGSDEPTRECRECLDAWLRRNARRARGTA